MLFYRQTLEMTSGGAGAKRIEEVSGVLKTVKKAVSRACFAFTGLALVVMFTPLANWLATPLLVEEGPQEATDIIAVLGGGAYANGVLGSASNERLIKAVLLYNEGRAPKLVFTGGKVVGVASKLNHTLLGAKNVEKARFAEAALMRDIAVGMGVPQTDCVVEDESLSTYENLKNLKALMERQGWSSAAIVSSPVHMRRAAMAAGRLGMDFTPVPAMDATFCKTGPLARVHLMREVLWEYAAFGLYWLRGQV